MAEFSAFTPIPGQHKDPSNDWITHARVVAVVVTYHPEPGILTRLVSAIEFQVTSIVLVCNSPVELPKAQGNSCCGRTIIRNQTNIGVAAAQNQGLRQCRLERADFVLFLDQDSMPDTTFVANLLVATKHLADRGIAVSAVGPLLVDADDGTEWPYLSAAWFHTREETRPDINGVCRTDMLYSSGSLVRLAHFSTVGYFMESLFVDHVDLEWCYRASRYGLHCFGIPSIRLRHRMGEGHVRFFGRLHSIHSASRNYYAFRNTIILLGLGHIPARWKLNEIIRLIPRCIFYGLIGKSLLPHLSNCLRGITDGISYHVKQGKPSDFPHPPSP